MARSRPSVGRRIFRSVARFSITVLIGVGATLAWQSYGNAARAMVAARVPALAWLLPVSATKPPDVASTAPASVQQIGSLASNLDIVRRSVGQLAAKQEQMAQNLATLQAVEDDIRRKMSYAPPSAFQEAAPIPQQKPRQPRGQSSSAPHAAPAGEPRPR